MAVPLPGIYQKRLKGRKGVKEEKKHELSLSPYILGIRIREGKSLDINIKLREEK